MRLEGSLDAFSLPDIFQLLSFTKKTGGLHLRRDTQQGAEQGGQHGVVFVTTGSLTGGSSDINRQGLARRLVGAGSVDDDALAQAVSAAVEAADIGVARALQHAGAVDEGALHEAGAEHVIDTVFDLMRWADGDFAFVVDEPNPDDVGVSVSVEDAVAEARRRLEGWAQVSTTIPSPDTVLGVALAPPDDPMLSREEWALLALVDGRRTVAEVVTATGRGEFAVVSTLASLVDRGLLVVTGEGQQPAVAALLRRLSSLSAAETGTADDFVIAAEPVSVELAKPAKPTKPAKPAKDAERTEAGLSARLGSVFSDEVDADDDVDDVDERVDDFVTDVVDTPVQRAPEKAVAQPRAEAEFEEDAPAEVIPPRAEPFLPRRRPEHLDDDMPSDLPVDMPGDFAAVTGGMSTVVGSVDGSSAMAAETAPSAFIERDPSVNKSLLLRLIAGVRGL